MKKLSKKGQITFFIIIGIVLIIIFLTLFIMLNTKTEEETQREFAKATQKSADQVQLENFVKSCLDLTVSEGLSLLGKQGGRIFETQGGTIALGDAKKDYLFVPGQNSYIAYSIKQFKSGKGTTFSVDLPEYPYVEFPVLAEQYFLGGLYGYVYFPVLEDPSNDDNDKTIKVQLEKYIENNLQKCTKSFANFPNLEVSEEDVEASVTFSNRTTLIDIKYPLKARKKATNELMEMETFFVNPNVNMKGMYQFIREILNAETLTIEHKLSGKQSGSIKIKDINKDVSGGFDDVVIVEDSRSILNGVPYSINLLIVNRPPALHHIKVHELPSIKRLYKLIGDSENIFKIEDECGNVIYNFKQELNQLSPAGMHLQYYDPDEDILDISYINNLPDQISDEESPPYADQKTVFVNVSDGEFSDIQQLTLNVLDWGAETPSCEPAGLLEPTIILSSPWNNHPSFEGEVLTNVPNVKIGWGPVPGADEYYIYEGENQIASTSETYYLKTFDNPSAYNQVYYYSIEASNGTDVSPRSPSASVSLSCTPNSGQASMNGLDEDCDTEVDESEDIGLFIRESFDIWNLNDNCRSLMSGRGYTATCRGNDCGSIQSSASFNAPCGANSFISGIMPEDYYGVSVWSDWSDNQMMALTVDANIKKTPAQIKSDGCIIKSQFGFTFAWGPNTNPLEMVCWRYAGTPIYH